MKKFVLLAICLYSSNIFAQRVENIQAEQRGDKIYISYDLIDHSCCDNFDIALYASLNEECSNDDNRRKLREVYGDVGRQIRPGRDKVIVWNVLDEVDELKNVRFFVQAKNLTPHAPRAVVASSSTMSYGSYGRHVAPKLPGVPSLYESPHRRATTIIVHSDRQASASPSPSPSPSPSRSYTYDYDHHRKKKRKKSKGIFLTYNASEHMRYGGRMGRLSGIGSYMAVRVGNGAPNDEEAFSTGSFMVGPTLRLIKTRPFKLYAYGGMGYGKWFIARKHGSQPTLGDNIFASGVEYEWGGILTIGRLTFTGGLTTLRSFRSEATFGLGFTFGSKY